MYKCFENYGFSLDLGNSKHNKFKTGNPYRDESKDEINNRIMIMLMDLNHRGELGHVVVASTGHSLANSIHFFNSRFLGFITVAGFKESLALDVQ